MAAPSKNFTVIADSAIDADSPLTEDLMQDLRDNDIHLEEWLGDSYTAAKDHNHDGTNSAVISPNNGQVLLDVYLAEHELTETGTSYVDKYEARFYLQTAQALNLRGSFHLKTSVGGTDGVLAIIDVDGVTGGVTLERTAGTYAWVDSNAVFTTASLAAGWHTVKVQIKRVNNGGAETVYIDGASVVAY